MLLPQVYSCDGCSSKKCICSSIPWNYCLNVFFHVLYNVNKRVRTWPFQLQRIVYQGVYKLHFTKSLVELNAMIRQIQDIWNGHGNQNLKDFADYFFRQWCDVEDNMGFWRWQIYHSPSGFATTLQSQTNSWKSPWLSTLFDTIPR